MRGTIDNDNGPQGNKHNLWGVNKWVEVEHTMESFDQGTMMWIHCQKRRNLPLEHVGSKVLNDF